MFILRKTKLVLMTLLTLGCTACSHIETSEIEVTKSGTLVIGVFQTQNELLEMAKSISIEQVNVSITEEPQYVELSVPNNNGFKSYMDCSCITDENSEQYAFKFNYLCSASGIMVVDGRYVIAVGSYYTTEIGARIDLVMSNGSVVNCIVGDVKDDGDTDSTNRQHSIDNSVVEFIVNTDSLSDKVRLTGDCSYADERLMGEIESIRVYTIN